MRRAEAVRRTTAAASGLLPGAASQMAKMERLAKLGREGSAVLQLVYADIASSAQRHELYRELWGKEFALGISTSAAASLSGGADCSCTFLIRDAASTDSNTRTQTDSVASGAAQRSRHSSSSSFSCSAAATATNDTSASTMPTRGDCTPCRALGPACTRQRSQSTASTLRLVHGGIRSFGIAGPW